MKSLSRKHFYLLSLLSGLLLWAGWPAHGFPLLLLIAFCPLLIIESALTTKSAVFFGYAYLSMLTWNTLTTWWVCNSTIVGGVIAIVCNSFFMAIILWLFHITKRRTNTSLGFLSLPVYWLAFEYVHLNWQLSWPWLTLGFGFSNYVSLLQWYTITGPLGGSLWILLCNMGIFKIMYARITKEYPNRGAIILTSLLIAVPVAGSVFMYNSPANPVKKRAIDVVVVQPNIDPYNEKFSGNFEEQINKMFQLADTKLDSTTAYLIFPETALTDPDIWENNFKDNNSIQLLWRYLRIHPQLRLVTGAETYKAYLNGEKPTESARQFTDDKGYYDAFNTALQLDSSRKIEVYHKCKLVPGVEFMPFAKLLAPLAKLAFDLGGTSGTLGTQKEPSVFYSPYSKTTIAPAICYESIYGGYIGKYIQKGAQLIFIITNDGWWKDTPGYKQHLCYGAMLAAETRKEIVQCANTGISAIINDRGAILQQTGWWTPAVIKATLHPSDNVTFYALHGDYLGLYACVLSILCIAYLFIKRISSNSGLS